MSNLHTLPEKFSSASLLIATCVPNAAAPNPVQTKCCSTITASLLILPHKSTDRNHYMIEITNDMSKQRFAMYSKNVLYFLSAPFKPFDSSIVQDYWIK
jgi:hypothetical protein